MKISAQEEYGLRCLLRLARAPEAAPSDQGDVTVVTRRLKF